MVRHHLDADALQVEHAGVLHQQPQVAHGMVLPDPRGAQDMDVGHVRMMLQHVPHRLRHIIVVLFLHRHDDRRQLFLQPPRQRVHVPNHDLRQPLLPELPQILHRRPVAAHHRLRTL